MQSINMIACQIVWLGTFWAVLSPKVPSCVGGAVVLWMLNIAVLGNMADFRNCHGDTEIWFNVASAFLTLWVIWLLEIHLPAKRRLLA